MFYLSRKRLRTPKLLIPGAKPIGPVRIDRTNKLGRYVRYAYLPQNHVNESLGSRTAPGSAADGMSISTDLHGAYRAATDSNDAQYAEGVPVIGTQDFFMYGVLRANTSGNTPCLFGVGDTGSGEWMFNISNIAGGLFRFYCGGGGINASITRPVTGEYYVAYASRVGSTLLIANVSLDTWLLNSDVDTTASVDLNNTTHPLGVNCANITSSTTDTTRVNNGDVYFSALGLGYGNISTDFVRALARDPYQVLSSPGPEYLAFSTGYAPPTAIDSEAKRKAIPGVARPWMRSQGNDGSAGRAWRASSGNAYPVANFQAPGGFQPAWAMNSTHIIYPGL